ncbi:MAG TPA: DUF222 domain-containing protein [Candidatus Dormibacteraeota bacterium]
MCRATDNPIERMRSALEEMPGWLSTQKGSALGQLVLDCRQIINRVEGFSAEATRRFEKSGAYADDGALGIVPWLKDKAKLSGADAAQHVEVARQLEQLPRTEEALARGEIGFQHAAAMARSAEHVGAAAVRKHETSLLKSASATDAGTFVGIVKDFEHRVDADSALAEANRAHQRRYLSISEPINGLARVEGQLVPEAAATIRTAIEPFMKPSKSDERTAGQRMHDALVEALRPGCAHRASADTRTKPRLGDTGAPRVQLIIKSSLDTLAGIKGAPAGELQWGGAIPAETVRRLACDSAITRVTGLGELEAEITHAARTTPPSTRRALVVRDGHCVFPGCDRPPPWCQSHHLKFWGDGGPTKLDNLGLLCTAHHRKVHEEGWTLERTGERWSARPAVAGVSPRARST